MWKGDVLIADLEELETMDASELYSKRLNAKEVIFSKRKWKIHFPVAEGRIKLPGGDQDLRTYRTASSSSSNLVDGASHPEMRDRPAAH